MIPSLLARHLRQGLSDYLRTTFPIATPAFQPMLKRFLDAEGELFRGPYISLGLPFVQAESAEGFFTGVPLPFPPYAHQAAAFRRLTGPTPRGTIVATGTGSGKTESFLLPILEHCWQRRGEPGVKAILIYPMNALATDQAKRLADLIHRADSLRGQLTAGLWVGQSEETPRDHMAADGLITDKAHLAKNPPDILLTNYKMLDILLNRPKDQGLWRDNGPETLRFVAVDELHTFDGAQGTDLACLLRRLKARLRTPKGHLIGIGTSATLGGPAAADDLVKYAQDIFGEPFELAGLVGETRLDAAAFLDGRAPVYQALPATDLLCQLADDPSRADRALGEALAPHYFEGALPPGPEWPLALGEALKGHVAFQTLLRALNGRAVAAESLCEAIGRELPAWQALAPADQAFQLEALLALVALARIRVGDAHRPFVSLRVQLWLRELRRMVASVEAAPVLRFSTDLTDDQRSVHLPVVHCRDCGQTGWAGVKPARSTKVRPELKAFYQAFFAKDPEVVFLFPVNGAGPAASSAGVPSVLCSECLSLPLHKTRATACPDCGCDALIPVYVPNSVTETKRGLRGHHDCPACESEDALTIMGAQAASLTSVLVGQLFGARLNDDKKLLTFSDSVQDASHRASFFAARTHPFGIRTALAQCLHAPETGTMTLSEVAEKFEVYWRARLDATAYASQFLPPDLAWIEEFEQMQSSGAPPAVGGTLEHFLRQRLGWDLMSELGWRARIGRTLEKSCLAIARVGEQALAPAVAALHQRLTEEFAVLRDLTPGETHTFVLGVVRQLRLMGAIQLPVLETYVDEGCKPYTFKLPRYRYLPALGPNKRPRFVGTGRSRYLEPLVRGHREPETWFQVWATKCWSTPNRATLLQANLADALLMTFGVLTRTGLLVATEVKDQTVWGLDPNVLDVLTDVARLECAKCDQAISVGSDEALAWAAAPCPRKGCDGRLAAAHRPDDYYARFYRDGELARIYAAEHTGLLERATRESVETAFMSRPPERRPWHPNLLSCTPTLEMGIDIGDLSSVVLCSVPPGQANYLQRVGRAGRTDGNALTLTIANARPHDLYFFAEPTAMIQGEVKPPGVFLGAAAVLDRQLTAYCLDQWVAAGVTDKALPMQVRAVLPALKTQAADRFPHNFLAFVSVNQASLLTSFLAMFDPPLADEPQAHLAGFISGGATTGGPLAYRLIAALQQLATQAEGLQKRARRLGELLKQLEESPTQALDHADRLEELKREQGNVQGLVRHLLDRNLYNFLSDEGLLPNYAFPEAGVALHSIIYRKKERLQADDKSAYNKRLYTYDRPASTALGELAPNSVFYAEGRHVRVDQVDLNVSSVEPWRFCPECQYCEPEGEEVGVVCPRCASAMWIDAAQRRDLLRMRQVYATTDDRTSRATDERDDRELSFFERDLLVDAPPEQVTAAFRVKALAFPFGFEVLAKAQFRDVNFGAADSQAPGWVLGGNEKKGKGFVLCRLCGKVQKSAGPTKPGQEPDEPQHTLGCPARNKDAPTLLAEVLYLYREFTSEALRLLLPVAAVGGGDTEVKSLTAALQLGLTRFYRGAIDHLRVTRMDEPDRETGLRKQFLVLYDSVPGGTGYLKQLATDPAVLTGVFRLARDHMRACACATDTTKDGCYQCILAYGNSRDMAKISRRVAFDLLTQILAHAQEWEAVPTLRDVDLAGLSESVLEERFLDRLKSWAGDTWRWAAIDGKPGFTCRIGSTTWQVAQQVELNHTQGVATFMRADFVLTPVGTGGKPVVVFTDGYAYHRSRLATDAAQRTALIRSGLYLVWSLSYHDVEEEKPKGWDALAVVPASGELPPQAGPGALLPGAAQFPKTLGRFGELNGHVAPASLAPLHSLALLKRFLESPDEAGWRTHALALAVATYGPPAITEADWLTGLAGRMPDEISAGWAGAAAVLARRPCGLGEIFVRVPHAAVATADASAATVVLALPAEAPEEMVAEWNTALRALNILQFLPGFAVLAPDQIWRTPQPPPPPPDDPAWLDAFAFTARPYHPVLEHLRAAGVPAPEPGYELPSSTGQVLGEAELAWQAARVALLKDSELRFQPAFEAHGWRCWPLTAISEDLTQLDEVIAHVCQPA